MDEEELDKFISGAKRLQELRIQKLIHLFEKFGFTEWQEMDQIKKKKSNSEIHWYIRLLNE